MELFHVLLSLVWLAVAAFQGAQGSIAERKLLTELFEDYNRVERPTIDSRDTVKVSIGLTLLSIVNADSRTNTLETNAWIVSEWSDPNLRWNPADYGNITDLRIPPSKIWRPDVYLYNSAHEVFDGTFETLVVLRHNGSLTYVPPGIHKTSCLFDMRYYPYDEQKCSIKLGSWAHDGGQIDLQLLTGEGADVSSYVPSPEWTLIAVPATREALYYSCCPDPYVSVTFILHMRRKGRVILLSYKVINSFICLMILLSFAMPAASGQKLTVGIITLVVNICTIASLNSMLPSHHDLKLAFYFAELSSLAFSSVFANTLTVYIYYRSREVPALLRRLLDKIHRSHLSLIFPNRNYEINELAEDNHCNPSYVGSNEDAQGLVQEINSLKRKISMQTKAQQLMSEWNYLSSVVDRCFVVVYALCILIFYVTLFPSFNTSEDGIQGEKFL